MSVVERISDVNREQLAKAAKTVLKHVPSLFCGLNVAQYRAFKDTYTRDSVTGISPAINIVSFANGVGKTHLLVLDMIGYTLGSLFLNKDAFPKCAIEHYDSLAPLRDEGKLVLRLVCAAVDMSGDGSVITLLKELFPAAKLTAKDQLGTYHQIDVPHPTIPGVVNSISVRTFDQSVLKHSGSTCDRVWVNEPLPDNLVGETVGRIRTKKGRPQGSILMCATLLDGASWVQEFDDDSELKVNHVRGHLFENCDGAEVTDRMAAEVKQTVGVTLQKNEQGCGYITNGVLTKASIDVMIKAWMRGSPQELEARKSGAPISGGGRIWPSFKSDVHVVDNYTVNPKWPVVMIADPHGARPTAALWAQITPQGRLYIFAEWPDTVGFGYYETLDERKYTIPQECEIWDRLETAYGIKGASIMRVGDPNRFRESQPYSGQTLHNEYAKHGFRFNLDTVDDLKIGHERVSEYLYFDEMRLAANPNDISALPRLFVKKECRNTVRALENYAFKKGRKVGSSVTENVNQKFKDFADCVRYLCVSHSMRGFRDVSDHGATSSDYKKFCDGKIPKGYRKPPFGFNHGKRHAA